MHLPQKKMLQRMLKKFALATDKYKLRMIAFFAVLGSLFSIFLDTLFD